jgi:hypothetical protein
MYWTGTYDSSTFESLEKNGQRSLTRRSYYCVIYKGKILKGFDFDAAINKLVKKFSLTREKAKKSGHRVLPRQYIDIHGYPVNPDKLV